MNIRWIIILSENGCGCKKDDEGLLLYVKRQNYAFGLSIRSSIRGLRRTSVTCNTRVFTFKVETVVIVLLIINC